MFQTNNILDHMLHTNCHTLDRNFLLSIVMLHFLDQFHQDVTIYDYNATKHQYPMEYLQRK